MTKPSVKIVAKRRVVMQELKKTYTNYKAYIMASHFRRDTTNLNHAKNCFVSSSKDRELEGSFSSFNSLLMTVQEFFHQNNLK